jgi:chromosome segregation ATPase
MNEEPTKDLPNRMSFEERVFARFDSVDARFDTVDARLEKLESRAYDTKPIWQRALAAIMETGLEVGEIKKKVGVIESKVAVIETDLAEVKTEVIGMKTDNAGMRSEFAEVRRELKQQVNKRLDLILEFLLEDRDNIRDAQDRIKQLETKLA